jgi:RNA-directed DNA polymerase
VDNDKIHSSKHELLKLLGIRDNYLYPNFSTKYREIEKPKKHGGTRTIKPPNLNLRKIQRIILDKILYKHTQLDCVYGLSKNKSILDNAKFHQKNASEQLLILDIENFFPSVPKKRINNIFKNLGFNKENSSILTKLCTIDGSLPQGAPTSPYLASMVCLKLDKEIFTYCKRRGFIYTRYFDDISISGKNISDKNIKQIERIISRHGFNCNKDKREFFDFNTDKTINSVFISKSVLSVTDSYKKEIADIYQKLLAEDTIQNKRIFAGKFGFFLHINRKEAETFLKKLK